MKSIEWWFIQPFDPDESGIWSILSVHNSTTRTLDPKRIGRLVSKSEYFVETFQTSSVVHDVNSKLGS